MTVGHCAWAQVPAPGVHEVSVRDCEPPEHVDHGPQTTVAAVHIPQVRVSTVPMGRHCAAAQVPVPGVQAVSVRCSCPPLHADQGLQVSAAGVQVGVPPHTVLVSVGAGQNAPDAPPVPAQEPKYPLSEELGSVQVLSWSSHDWPPCVKVRTVRQGLQGGGTTRVHIETHQPPSAAFLATESQSVPRWKMGTSCVHVDDSS